ncbi:MAG: hypothetical protein MPJ24_06140 [Pirellulaceae bacterium]|nr:hypothetical protein [Pirellulaceae bacterium]
MDCPKLGPSEKELVSKVLGYLNFSTGNEDSTVLGQLRILFDFFEEIHHKSLDTKSAKKESPPAYKLLLKTLESELDQLAGNSPTFRDTRQAKSVLQFIREHFISGYLSFHKDLLFHQSAEEIFRPYFLGHAFVITLQTLHDDQEISLDKVLARFNDFLGYRPLAILEGQSIEPYPHEYIRPVPLYHHEVGVDNTKYQAVVKQAIEFLKATDDDILDLAHFNLANLQEIAFDPRAYDFDHPVNKRHNYQFGQWDPHTLNKNGDYCRFVIQQVTLDALLARVKQNKKQTNKKQISSQECLAEAAAVLAGTILMASGTSGSHPAAHDSNTTLASLLPTIAYTRDEFYKQLIAKLAPEHSARLRDEAIATKQPLGRARQALNTELSRRRAAQLEHVHLAKIFARMGHPASATRQAEIVPVASARMLCRIDCLLTSGYQAMKADKLDKAASYLPDMIDLLMRGIECGAIVDPWGIMATGGYYSLFPALENSIRDHRIEALIALVNELFAYYSRLWAKAAANNDQGICEQIYLQYRATTDWWHQFAAHEVPEVNAPNADGAFHAARHVADALSLWKKEGATSGDIRFWAPHADMFRTPKGYALVINALLQNNDHLASMSLLIHWLSQAEEIALEERQYSFYKLASRWLQSLIAYHKEDPQTAWQQVKRFFDYLEANAEKLWQVPTFAFVKNSSQTSKNENNQDEETTGAEGASDEIFKAAYEEVVFEDSADDGNEGAIFENQIAPDHRAMEAEALRLDKHLTFLITLAKLWRLGPIAFQNLDQTVQNGDPEEGHLENRQTPDTEVIRHWAKQAQKNYTELLNLLDDVSKFALPETDGRRESMIEYDRMRLVKESIIERVITASVTTAEVFYLLLTTNLSIFNKETPLLDQLAPLSQEKEDPQSTNLATQVERILKEHFPSLSAHLSPENSLFVMVVTSLQSGARKKVREFWPLLMATLTQNRLLYIPINRGGNPLEIVEIKIRQQLIRLLLHWLPRLGLFEETCELLETSRQMERNQKTNAGAVTEFDALYKIGYRALVDNIVSSSETWEEEINQKFKTREAGLVSCLEELTETLLLNWLAHSQTLRLSSLELVLQPENWDKLVSFIKNYGADIFTQQFFNIGNIRAILHQGAHNWLTQCKESPRGEQHFSLLDDLNEKISVEDAGYLLTIVLEGIMENYAEYKDYNNTTTQSDKGELLYTLLDFLRLRSAYDRVAWNLKPVVLTHETLVRRHHHHAARMWRRALTERIGSEATRYLDELKRLQVEHAMQMPTIAHRLEERFIQPLIIDRVLALVEPAMKERLEGEPQPAFELLEEECELLTKQPSGAGLDIPVWISKLAQEVSRVEKNILDLSPQNLVDELIPLLPQNYEETQRQLVVITSRQKLLFKME